MHLAIADVHVIRGDLARAVTVANDERADLVGFRIPENLPHASSAMTILRSHLGVEANAHGNTSVRINLRRDGASARQPAERAERYGTTCCATAASGIFFRFPNLSGTER